MIITYPLNGIEYTAEDAETYLCSRTSGLFSDDVNFEISDMTITVSPFLAWIKNTEFSGKSVAVTESVELTISPAESILDRIDRIVLRFSASKNASELVVLEGDASSSPSGKELTRNSVTYELCLAEVSVKGGSNSLSTVDIKSTVLDEDLCGLMRDGVTKIPTANLQEQVNELLENLRKELESVENESAYILKNGNVAMEGNFNNGGFRSVNLADPEEDTDAVNKSYVNNNFIPAKVFNEIGMAEDAYCQPGLEEFEISRWLNPPMNPLEEYRTFEFVEGHPVYVKVLGCGALPAAGTKTITFNEGLSARVIDFNALVYSSNESNLTTHKFPLIVSQEVVGVCYFNATGNFVIQTYSDLSSFECVLTVKYVREN